MKIVRYPHPALRYKAAPVKLIDAEVRKVIDALRDLTYQHEGLGLAAPQIGIPLQLFFMNPTGEKSQPEAEMVFINPVISEKEGMIEKEEGCLSFPDLYQNVRRAASIRVKAYDPEGQAMDIKLEELPARVVQHETDHLHGKLFIDYFNVIGKLASRAALTKFEKDFQQQLDRGDLPSKKEMLKKLHELEEYYAGNRGSEKDKTIL